MWNIIELFKYIKYAIETIKFNLFYRWFHDAQISLFDNCSWKSFKQNKKGE
jgi:hypothetical protein